MFLLMTVVQGVSTMILEKEQEVYKRLLLTHLTYQQLSRRKNARIDYYLFSPIGYYYYWNQRSVWG